MKNNIITLAFVVLLTACGGLYASVDNLRNQVITLKKNQEIELAKIEKTKQEINKLKTEKEKQEINKLKTEKEKQEIEIAKKKNQKTVYVGTDKTRLEYTIRKVLTYMEEAHIEDYTALLMYTALVESNLGIYRKQKRGPALSVFQIEPNTEKSMWDIFMKRNPIWSGKVKALMGTSVPGLTQMETNLEYATAMAYLYYKWRHKAAPDGKNTKLVAEYHKKHFNTAMGKACPVKGAKMAEAVFGE